MCGHGWRPARWARCYSLPAGRPHPAEDVWIDGQRGSTSWGLIFLGTVALPASVDGQVTAVITIATGVVERTLSGVPPPVAGSVSAVSGEAAVGHATRTALHIASLADIAEH